MINIKTWRSLDDKLKPNLLSLRKIGQTLQTEAEILAAVSHVKRSLTGICDSSSKRLRDIKDTPLIDNHGRL